MSQFPMNLHGSTSHPKIALSRFSRFIRGAETSPISASFVPNKDIFPSAKPSTSKLWRRCKISTRWLFFGNFTGTGKNLGFSEYIGKLKVQNSHSWGCMSRSGFCFVMSSAQHWAGSNGKRVDHDTKRLFSYLRLDFCHYFPSLLVPVNTSRAAALSPLAFWRPRFRAFTAVARHAEVTPWRRISRRADSSNLIRRGELDALLK